MQDGAEADSDPVIQKLFGVGLHARLVCEESGEAIEEDTSVYELKCNITVDVNHVTEGIKLGLQDDREKNSEALGRLALYKASTASELNLAVPTRHLKTGLSKGGEFCIWLPSPV